MNALADISFRGRIRHNESMSRHTSWRVGGPADIYFEPADARDLADFLAGLDRDSEIHWVGLGSNLLVRDGGLRGVVIATHRGLSGLERLEDGLVRAEAGVACAKLARQCARWKLGPAEFFAGIPGTVGGALAMNAGAFDGETWQRVSAVETVDRTGQIRTRLCEEFEVSYRTVEMPAAEWFIAGLFDFREQADASVESIRKLLARRKESQPIGRPSCGSVFRNPRNDYAARLIEACGLKGLRLGGAEVSGKHANFIINTGSATAADVESLIKKIQDQVRREQGVDLVAEVRIVGEPIAD
ncbi:MAG: UDP-N-acetylmuramate dehydrogenase [Gammaproteobacteria bacterium]|nr:UDP-N-acetylmuramate dehydrogenase [Gammaproteobacteria bacterium]